MRFRYCLFLLLVLVIVSPALNAATRYVGHGGSDVGTCTSSALPCNSVQYAIGQSTSGDTIRIDEGAPHVESITLTTAIADLTIEGGWTDSFGWQHLEPTATVIDGDDSDRVILVQPGAGTTHLTLTNLTLQGGSASPYGGGLEVSTLAAGVSAKVTLDHVVLRENLAGTGGGAAVRAWGGTAELDIQHSLIVSNIAGQGGGLAAVADLGGTAKLRLESSTVLGNEAQEWSDSNGWGGALYATSIRQGLADVDIVNSVLAQNTADEGGIYGRSGACSGCGVVATTDIDLLNSTVTDNSTTGIVVRSWDRGTTDLNLVNAIAWGDTVDDIDAMGDHETTEVSAWNSDVGRTNMQFNSTYSTIGDILAVNPQFVDPTAHDYHLSADSSLIDAGVCGVLLPNPLPGPPVYVRLAPILDIDDDTRPPPENLNDCDVGADEYFPFEHWVSPSGTDINNACLDPANPCATIQPSLNRVMLGHAGHHKAVVYVAAGTYAESLSITDSPAAVTISGGWSPDFSARNLSGFSTVIDANGLGSAVDFQVLNGTADLTLESLTLTDGLAALGGGLSFFCQISHGHLTLSRVVLHDNHATDSGGGIRIRPVACDLRVRIIDTMVTDNTAVNGGGGAWFRIDSGSSLYSSLSLSTVAGNDASYGGGVIFQQTGTGHGWLFINSSLLTLNTGVADGADDLWIEESGSDFVLVQAKHSSILSVTQYGGLYQPEAGVIAANPGFADPAAGDYHLTPYSPVRDLSPCGLGSSFDCDGDPRPTTDCDMGADEFQGAWIPPLDLWITNELLSGGMVREACRSITAGPAVTAGPGLVELRAGGYLVFYDGFEVKSGADFVARLYLNPACP